MCRFYLSEPKHQGKYRYHLFQYIELYGWAKGAWYIHPQYGNLNVYDTEYLGECKMSVQGALAFRHMEERPRHCRGNFSEFCQKVTNSYWPGVKRLTEILLKDHPDYFSNPKDGVLMVHGKIGSPLDAIQLWNDKIAQSEDDVYNKLLRSKI